MNTQEIVAKLWRLCDVLRDDGITYHQYVTELTYILFLKMAKETYTEDKIPEGYRWDDLVAKDGIELKNSTRVFCSIWEKKALAGFGKSIRSPAVILTSQRISKRLLPLLMSWTGILPRRKGWAISMRVCWRKTPMKRNLVLVSILPLGH